MTNSGQEKPDPELHVVGGPDPGQAYETPLTLGPDSDHADDPIRHNLDTAAATQPAQNPEANPQVTDHPTGEDRARENAANEPPG
jgi:hypothetical protein